MKAVERKDTNVNPLQALLTFPQNCISDQVHALGTRR